MIWNDCSNSPIWVQAIMLENQCYQNIYLFQQYLWKDGIIWWRISSVLRDKAHCLWVQTAETVGHRKCISEDASACCHVMKLSGEEEGKVGLKRAKRPGWFSPRNIHFLNILEKLCWKEQQMSLIFIALIFHFLHRSYSLQQVAAQESTWVS